MKLEYDKLLSSVAFNCNLRHYLLEPPSSDAVAKAVEELVSLEAMTAGRASHFQTVCS